MSHQIRVVLAVRAVFVFYDMQYRVMIIDFRIRPPFGEVLSMSPFDVRCSGFDPEYPGQMYGHIPPRSVQSRDISVFMDEMDAAGIDYAAVSGRASASSGIFSKGCVSLKWCMSWSTVIRERLSGVAALESLDPAAPKMAWNVPQRSVRRRPSFRGCQR